jgi:hypothetical protein
MIPEFINKILRKRPAMTCAPTAAGGILTETRPIAAAAAASSSIGLLVGPKSETESGKTSVVHYNYRKDQNLAKVQL